MYRSCSCLSPLICKWKQWCKYLHMLEWNHMLLLNSERLDKFKRRVVFDNAPPLGWWPLANAPPWGKRWCHHQLALVPPNENVNRPLNRICMLRVVHKVLKLTHLFPVPRLTTVPGSSSPSCITNPAITLYPANLHPSGASRLRADRWFQHRAAILSPSVEVPGLYSCCTPFSFKREATAYCAADSFAAFLVLPAPHWYNSSPTL